MTKTPKHQALRRVKVYLLEDAWIDNGTGYCFGEIDEDKVPYLIVRNELDQKDVLLKAKIEGSIQFQRQQDTLIVWTDTKGHNIALSFQEKEGCLSLCDFIIKCHRGKFAPLISLIAVISNDMDGDITELITGPINYPPLEPTAGDLIEISNCFNENPNSSYQKQSISNFIKNGNYISKLIDIFNESEQNRKIKNLHLLCNIVKTLILFNEGLIIEMILDDENIMGVVGMLEYDPDFPQFKSNHRSFLRDDSKFKEVLPVKDEHIKKLIKKTFKLQFLKDVVLARLLDDPTFNLISTLIHFNQVEIIEFLEKGTFIDELFKLYQDEDNTEDTTIQKRDGIKLLHQFILIAKNLQPHQKTSFFKSLIKKGLFKTINFVMMDNSTEIRVIGTELIVTIIEHDVLLINGVVDDEEEEGEELNGNDEHDKGKNKSNNNDENQEIDSNINDEDDDNDDNDDFKHGNGNFFNGFDYEQDEEPPHITYRHREIVLSDDMTLLIILTQFLLEDNDPGLKIQAFEALKSLLDPVNNLNSAIMNNDDSMIDQLDATKFFKAFYDKVAPILFKPLMNIERKDDNQHNDELFIYLCELINFCSKDKSISRSFFLENHILIGITQLIKPTHKLQLRLAAVRSIKSIILLNDDYYTRYIISNNILEQVFKLFDETNGISNLANSTVLDLLEMVLLGIDKLDKRKNVKLLATYIVSNFKASLDSIDSVSSGKDLIKFAEQDVVNTSTTTNELNDDENYEDDDTLTRPPEISTEPLDEEDVLNNEEILKEKSLNRTSNKVPEKRSREEDLESSHEIKKKNSLREKFSNAGKKIASKFK